MTDLRVLLHEAAPAPGARVDVDALIAEADRRRRRRRIGLWFGSIAVALGVGGGAAGVLAPADRPSEVNTLPRPTGHIRETEVVSGPAHRTTTTTSRFSSASSAGARPEPAASSPSTPESRSTTAPEGCVSDGYPEGVGLNYTLTPRAEYPECQYHATRPAGYEGSGTWWVDIRRGNEAIVYHGGESPDCMPVGTIQPGDEVIVTASGAGSYIKAGPDYGC